LKDKGVDAKEVFVYHGTTLRAANAILTSGFKVPTDPHERLFPFQKAPGYFFHADSDLAWKNYAIK